MMQGESPAGMIKLGLKWIFVIILIVGMFLMLALLWLARPLVKSTEDINVLNPNHLIAHAGGAIDRHTYTNSKEALINALDNGFRYVELDLYETADSDIVCLHSLEDYWKMTSTDCEDLDTKSFLSLQLYGKYTPMTLNDAIKIWEKRPFYFVTDKISDPKILNRYFKKNRDKVIVEAFTLEDYVQLERDGYIPMFSIMALNVRGLYLYILNSIKYGKGIPRIVTNTYVSKYVYRIYKRLGAQQIAVYSLYDEDYQKIHEREYLEKLAGRAVDLVYVDFVKPNMKP